MIEGGGLGQFSPEEIGPIEVQRANGVVDLAVTDDAAAVEAARRYLSFFQERHSPSFEAPDQLALRNVIPAERRRAYDVHAVIEGLFDVGTTLELRPGFAPGMVTALARLDGRSVGCWPTTGAPRRRHRRGRGRQGGALLAALRCLRPAGRFLVRHARFHGWT